MLTIEAGKTWLANDDKFVEWLADLGVIAKNVYKVEIDFDEDMMKVFAFDTDAQGAKFIRDDEDAPDHGGPALKQPYLVNLADHPIPGVLREEARRLDAIAEAEGHENLAEGLAEPPQPVEVEPEEDDITADPR